MSVTLKEISTNFNKKKKKKKERKEKKSLQEKQNVPGKIILTFLQCLPQAHEEVKIYLKI